MHTTRGNFSRRAVLGSVVTAAAAASIPARSTAQPRQSAAFDHVVIGAGVFGSWTAWNLARQGHKVLLVDAWGPAHSRASSGGETRLIRTEYAGSALYTRWAWQSLGEWQALAARHEAPLFHQSGALYLFGKDNAGIDASIAMQRALGIPIEKLPAADMARRWPQINLTGIALGVFQPTMGALMARRGVQAVVDEFVAAGGEYRQVSIAPPTANGALIDQITTSDGEAIHAGNFIFACGPWLPRLFPDVVASRIVPSRQDVFFFAPAAGDTRFASTNMPAWVDMTSDNLHYGFPDIEARGFKIALDVHGPRADPDTMDRRIGDTELAAVRTYLARRFPDLADRPLAEARVCQYENTDNGHLLIDRHPGWNNCWIVGGGSGHGFKHGPAVGRYVSALVAGDAAVEVDLTFARHAPH